MGGGGGGKGKGQVREGYFRASGAVDQVGGGNQTTGKKQFRGRKVTGRSNRNSLQTFSAAAWGEGKRVGGQKNGKREQ